MTVVRTITGVWRGSLSRSALTERYEVTFYGDALARRLAASLGSDCNCRREGCEICTLREQLKAVLPSGVM